MLGKLGCMPNSLAMEDAALVHGAKDKGRTRFKEIVLDVFAEADETFRKVFGFVLFDLPDVEIDKAAILPLSVSTRLLLANERAFVFSLCFEDDKGKALFVEQQKINVALG